jgi:hypothetical protein
MEIAMSSPGYPVLHVARRVKNCGGPVVLKDTVLRSGCQIFGRMLNYQDNFDVCCLV